MATTAPLGPLFPCRRPCSKTLARSAASPHELGPPLICYSTVSRRRPSTVRAPPCGKDRRRPFPPFFSPFQSMRDRSPEHPDHPSPPSVLSAAFLPVPIPWMCSQSRALSPRPNLARSEPRTTEFGQVRRPRRRSPSRVAASSAQRRAEPPLRSPSHVSVCSRATPPAEPRADARPATTYSAPSDLDPMILIRSEPSQQI